MPLKITVPSARVHEYYNPETGKSSAVDGILDSDHSQLKKPAKQTFPVMKALRACIALP
jgi:hypothetical protein